MNSESFAVVVDGWFDGQSHYPQPTTITIDQGSISTITSGDHSAAFKSQQRAVVKGGFLLPGLVDAHVHLFLDGKPTDGAERSAHMKQALPELTEAARRSARQSLDCGVTLVRDAGDKHGINHQIRQEALSANDMARVRSAGLGVKRPKRYGAFMAQDAVDNAAIQNSVAQLATDSDEIKLILTGIIDFDAGAVTDEPQFDLDSTCLVVDSARKLGLNTFAHCSGEKGLAIAANAGVGSIEHGFFMNRETLSVMRDRDVAWTPTFCPVHFQWAHPEAVGWSPQTVDNLRRILDQHAEHLRLADEMGVRLLLGTDAGSMGVQHGYAVFDEIQRYLEAGISLEKTLRSATSTTRNHFELLYPILVEGAPFEAVLLEKSPFEQIETLRKPLSVWLPSGANT
jgi:imidazolonepropionase-like amidohydrolase